MALPPIHGMQNYRPNLNTATGGAEARAFKERKHHSSEDTDLNYEPNSEALASLMELKRERGLI